jgi:hypothetical protein
MSSHGQKALVTQNLFHPTTRLARTCHLQQQVSEPVPIALPEGRMGSIQQEIAAKFNGIDSTPKGKRQNFKID